MARKLISIVTPTYNEIHNIEELLIQVYDVIKPLENYDFEFLVIDNCSTDGTQDKLRELAAQNSSLKVIFNNRNFGHIRSPYWGILQSNGDATIYMASDLQDPPSLIPEFIQNWEKGFEVVLAVKPTSAGNPLMHFFRRQYYYLLDKISNVSIIKDSTGFGIYDKKVISQLREINDPYPFLRGLISELGYSVKLIPFNQPRRLRGLTKNNIFTLYDIAILGVISHSLVPIRFVGLFGAVTSAVCFTLAIVFLILKLLWWNSFPMGYAPIIIVVSFMFGIVLLSIAVLGEYIASIHTYARRRPIVVERERINF
jgi:dolichol-phosphate mannosyltransferase